MPAVNGSRGLNFSGQFDVKEILDGQKKVIDGFAKMKQSAEVAIKPLRIVSKDEVKPLTEYQAGLLKIKQEALELQKLKAEQSRADKAASLATQEALKKERELIKQRNEEAKKRVTSISDSKPEVAAFNASTTGTNGKIDAAFTAYLKEVKKDFDNGKISAQEYVAELERYSEVSVKSNKQVADSLKKVSVERKKSAIDLATEKQALEQEARALKNSAREMNASKGSIEQRRAALIRLNSVYDNLSANERNSASGQRLNGIISRLNGQVKELEANTGRAQRNVGNYQNAFTKGASKAFGALRLVANILPGIGVAGLLAFAVEPIIEYVKNLDLFKKKIDQIAETKKLINETNLKGAQDAQTEIVQLKVLYETAKNVALSSTQRFNAAKKLQDQYPQSFKNYSIEQIELGKVDAAYLKLTESILATARARASEAKIAENSSRILDDEQKMVDLQTERSIAISRQSVAQSEFNKQLAKAKGNAQALENVYASETVSIERRKVEKIDKQITDYARDREILDRRNLKLTENIVKEQKKGADIAGNSGAADKAKKETKEAESLSKKLTSIHNASFKKTIDQNDAEVDAIKQKYAELTKAADDYYKDPKNNRVVKINGQNYSKNQVYATLRADQEREVNTKIDDQKAKSLKEQLDKEKQLYADFEKFKSDFGLEKAKERYNDLINVDSSYLMEIAKRQENILGDPKAKGGDAGGGEYAEKQLAVLKQASDEAVKIEQERSDELLKEFMSFADQMKVLNENYQRDIAAAGDNPEVKAKITRKFNEDKKRIEDENTDKLESYERLFIGIEDLSTKSALQTLRNARRIFDEEKKAGSLTVDEIKKINDLLNKTEIDIKNKSGQGLIEIASAIDGIASSISGVNEEFGKVLSTVGSIVGQLGNVKKGIADFSKAKSEGNGLGQLTSGLGILGAGFSIFSTAVNGIKSVIGLFSKAQQREEQAAYSRDLQNRQAEALNKALERQISLLDDVYGTDRIKNYDAAIKQANDNAAKYQSDLVGKFALSGNKQLDDIITKINNGEKLSFTSNEAFIKANQAALDKLKLPSDLDSLRKLLYDGNKLDAGTSAIVENLIKAKETAQDLLNNLNKERTGTALESIADDFISTLTDGVQDFGKTFEETIQKSILNGFKGKIIQEQLQSFYNQFAELSADGGLTGDKAKENIQKLKDTYKTASEKAKADLEALSKATGVKLTNTGNGTSNSLKGSISASLTEETGGILASVFKGVQVSALSIDKKMTPLVNNSAIMINIATDTLNGIVAVGNNTLRTANNTDRLAAIETALISMDSKIQRGSNYNSILSSNGI